MPDMKDDVTNVIRMVSHDLSFPTDGEVSSEGGELDARSSSVITDTEEAVLVHLPVENYSSFSDDSTQLTDVNKHQCLEHTENKSIEENNACGNSVTEEKIFEIPILNMYDNFSDYHKENLNEECNEKESTDENSPKEECNSDCTEEYSLDCDRVKLQDETSQLEENVNSTNSSAGQSFSPLPSTSKDYAIIDMNDMMFNEANSTSPKSLDTKDDQLEVVGDSKVKVEPSVKSEEPHSLSIVECSSGSDNNDDEVVICSEVKPNIIDLSNEDKSDSDCEIIDVDDILNENKKVLSVTELPKPKRVKNHVEIIGDDPTGVVVVAPNSDNSMPSLQPLSLDRTEVEVIPDAQILPPLPALPPEPAENNYYPIFNELQDTLFNYFHGRKSTNTSDLHSLCVDSNSGVPNSFNNGFIPPFSLYPNNDSQSLHGRRKSRRKPEYNLRKRRRMEPVIDLSVTSTLHAKPHSSSDVIVIDVDSPVSIQRSNNLAQISVSIMAPIATPAPVMEPPRCDPCIAPRIEPTPVVNKPIQVTSSPADFPSGETSSMTPPRRLGDCPVCLENFSKVKAVSTFCGHLFCIGCITTVKKTSNKCPTCRKALKGKGYHPIFL